MAGLLEAMKEKKAESGLGHGAFARHLGISGAMWLKLRQEGGDRRNLAEKVFAKVALRYPDLRGLVIEELMAKYPDAPKHVVSGAAPVNGKNKRTRVRGGARNA